MSITFVGVDLYSASNFAAAIVMLEKSAAIDLNYAPTWAHMGRPYTTNASLRFGGRENYRRAEAAYEKAIALNPVFPEPRVYMANMLTDTGHVDGDRSDALRMLQQSATGGFFCYSYMTRDPLLNPLHNSSEFMRTLEEARRRHDQFQRRFGGEGS
jgi:tetratricopeptide (TPR) repeat protein